MPLTCNIDSRGKAVRLRSGIISLAAGLFCLVFWAMASDGVMAWSITAILLLSGAVMIFEARAGWCVMRAMGFKTRI